MAVVPARQRVTQQVQSRSTGELLAQMGMWIYGLPYAETLADGNVLVLYYLPADFGTQIAWARIDC